MSLTTCTLSWLLFTFHVFLGVSPYAFASPVVYQQAPLQNIVTWDNNSLFVRGERIVFLSGEFHPWRLPSPGLWLDVFQKIKALGFSGVSFYLNWGLLEGEPGFVRTEGIFALDEFFSAAQEAGIYLLARPGPYINSEVSGGGFPGWLQRNKAQLRSTDPEFLDATKKYIAHVGKIISEAQITKGGPVILLQPDNEYTLCSNSTGLQDISACLDKEFMQFVEDEYHEAGIMVPLLSNDAVPLGNFKPGSGVGEVDLYGFDFYPMSWGQQPCSNPSNWNRSSIPPAIYPTLVRNISLNTSPRSVVEFQGGSPDKWGGVGVHVCTALINEEFERVFYKINYGLKITIMNLYMTFGGTNWGNIGHSEGYTSYDVGAAIREDRTITREKYHELKSQANFHRVSPAYITARPGIDSTGIYTNTTALATTPLTGNRTRFYIVRHDDHQSTKSTAYQLYIMTSLGNITIPQLGGSLTLNGRDSKIHTTDYDIDGLNLIYSSAEIFTWSHTESRRILILYGGESESHEFALPDSIPTPVIQGTGVEYKQTSQAHIIKWSVQKERIFIRFGDEIDVYLLWRNDAYRYWTVDLPAPSPLGLYPSISRHGIQAKSGSIVVKAGYLLRNATITRQTLNLIGDVNCTTDLEIISSPSTISSITFNGLPLEVTENAVGNLEAVVAYKTPNIDISDLSMSHWSYHTSLPEIRSDYDDSEWKACNLTSSNNPRNLTTPTSLYSSDYGYHAGSFLYRGHFTATGSETGFSITTQGGLAYGHSVWLNEKFLGSFNGDPEARNHTQVFDLKLEVGKSYVITVLIDHMGYDLNFYADNQAMKNPRGILDYSLHGRRKDAVQWKMTGNLGGETYMDKSRGPLNEGAMFTERQGFHLPGVPTNGTGWQVRSPSQGIETAGVGFFSTTVELDFPTGYDIPLKFVLEGDKGAAGAANFRVQIFVNGWQFGKYVNNIGPQTSFPVPEGIINHHGPNYIALTLWALDAGGARLNTVRLAFDEVIQSGYRPPKTVQGERWQRRARAY